MPGMDGAEGPEAKGRGGTRGLALLLALAAIVLLPGVLSQRDFTVSDEARYAEVMREMRDDGHWLVPYLNGSFYPDKPPVFFWLALAAGRVTGGLNPHAGTLVAVLSALGLLAVTWWMGRHAHGDRAGMASACVLLGFVVFLLCAQVVRMDMTMALLVALSMASIQAGLGANRWGYFASHAAAGLAVLVKGPLGLLFPLVAALAVFARRRAWTEMRRYLLNPGLLVAAVLVGGWLAVAWGTGEHQFVRNLFVKQVAGRAVRDGAHGQPVWFFLALLPVLLLPWSPLLARALWRRRGTWTTGDGLFWAWFLGGLAAISVLHGKLFIYILPLLPAVALLVGPWLAQLWDSATAGRPPSAADRAALASSAILTFGLLAAVAAAFPAPDRLVRRLPVARPVVVCPRADPACTGRHRGRCVRSARADLRGCVPIGEQSGLVAPDRRRHPRAAGRGVDRGDVRLPGGQPRHRKLLRGRGCTGHRTRRTARLAGPAAPRGVADTEGLPPEPRLAGRDCRRAFASVHGGPGFLPCRVPQRGTVTVRRRRCACAAGAA
jgi:hypothetical protein